MRLKTLLSALTALLILPSIASAATTADFAPGPGDTASAGTWTRVFTVTKGAAGNAESKGVQTVTINCIGGAAPLSTMEYRVLKMNKNQNLNNPKSKTTLMNKAILNLRKSQVKFRD